MRRRGPGAPGASEEQSGRQMASFVRRKKMLLKKAMELSVLSDCNVAVIVFSPDGKLVQYSSVDEMDKLLEEYAQACQRPHERYTNTDLLKEYHQDMGQPDDRSTLALSRKRLNEMDAGAVGMAEPMLPPLPVVPHAEGIKPAGFMDDKNYPVSPGSEKAYKEITTQLDRWIEQLNNRGAPEFGSAMREPSAAGASPGAGKRFKSLSIMVPENTSQPILSQADNAPQAAQPTSSAGDGASLDSHGLIRVHSQSISGGILGLSMPSPSNLFFGLPSAGGLFTSRGGLNLDLPMPDSASSLGHAAGLEWPASSRDNMLPGFSDDNESGEELPGDLMVTGRGIKHTFGGRGEGLEVTSSGKSQAGDTPAGMEDLLVVSGIKVSLPAAGQTNKEGTVEGSGSGFEFPGFASQKEPTVTPTKAGIDIPLDIR